MKLWVSQGLNLYRLGSRTEDTGKLYVDSKNLLKEWKTEFFYQVRVEHEKDGSEPWSVRGDPVL